ncbi:MAG TPA: lamin tail domain-containing protein, partial [Flavisolibacter sp.]|nr:lamin tail domain-containing protein [Flavisolibacter sp.]
IDWYDNENKKNGGWSLEMIDPHNPCTGRDNWIASNGSLGGTPGKTNSVNAVNSDHTPPQLKSAYAPDNQTVALVFDEPLDSAGAAVTANYNLPGFNIEAATPLPPLFQTVQLRLRSPLSVGAIATITVNNVADCKGNVIGAYNKTDIGLPQPAAANDVVVNEILFNPRTGGSDYVEFFNRSKKIIDASALSLANRNNSSSVSSLKRLSTDPFYLFPGAYLVVTTDKPNLQAQYLVKNTDAVLQLSSLPSFPDDKGNVILQTDTGTVIDEVAYNKAWHFGLIDDAEGVALERIDPDDSSQKKSNWHSAASTAGFGTPTYRNSQFKAIDNPLAAISLSPAVFS